MSTQDKESKENAMLRLRINALYHNCMSSACFKREDAAKSDDEAEAMALRMEACAYETCAGWLFQATKL